MSLPSPTGGISVESSSDRTILSTGAIVGIVIGGAAVVALFVFSGWRFMARKKKLADSAPGTGPDRYNGRTELMSQAVAELSHDNCSKNGMSTRDQQLRLLRIVSYQDHNTDYYTARSPETPTMVELPAVAYHQETEAIRAFREEWPLSYRHDETGNK